MKKTLHSKENQTLIDELIAMRKKAGFKNQREFAKALKLSKSTVGYIELGERRIDMVEFYRICKVCGVNPVTQVKRLYKRFDEFTK